MKLTNLCILFIILEVSIITAINTRINHLTGIYSKTVEYNKALDSSVDDGTMDLVEVDSKRNIVLNKEKAVDQFFNSLYANFGVMDNGILQRRLREYIPIILITDENGFYIYYMDQYVEQGEVVLGDRWSEKYPYIYEDNGFIYKFTLGDMVTLYNKDTQEFITGNYKELGTIYTESIMAKKDIFDSIRRTAIIHAIEVKMNYYINKYNHMASQFGITYQFWLPIIDRADWYRTIDDISMFVIFQNYPYNAGSLDTYNRYAFGGARITKSHLYYIKNLNSIKYYHKENCRYLTVNGQENWYYTKEECALEGAFPCPYCNP